MAQFPNAKLKMPIRRRATGRAWGQGLDGSYTFCYLLDGKYSSTISLEPVLERTNEFVVESSDGNGCSLVVYVTGPDGL